MNDAFELVARALRSSAQEWVPARRGTIGIVVVAGLFIMIGMLWDISWHQTIGRDSIFVPPHVLEYIAAAIVGFTCGYVVLRTTFFSSPAIKSTMVRFWGMHGPLGAWISIWGVLALLSSVPFDDWWHQAYGLDVRVVTPPHMLLTAGQMAIVAGSLVAASSLQNRRAPDGQTSSFDAWVFALAGGVLCLGVGVFSLEDSIPARQHTALFYQVWSVVFPVLLVALARAGRMRWAATISVAVYMVVWIAMAQVLRHVPATPKLDPVYNPRTYMWPPFFPPLLVVPAVAIDVLRRRLRDFASWRSAAIVGAAFVVLFLLVEWPFAKFLVSDHAKNGLFNGDERAYSALPRPHQFAGEARSSALAIGLLAWTLSATLSSRVGMLCGGWLARIKR